MPTKAERNSAAVAAEVSVLMAEYEHERLADASVLSAAPDADGIEVSAEARAVINLQAALVSLPTDSPMRAVLQTALDAAIEAQAAVAEAQAQRAAQDAEETQARAAALQFGLSDALLSDMLASIDAKYAPAPEAVEAAADVEAAVPTNNRKQPGAVTLARNAAVAEALTTDAAMAARADSTIDAYLATEAKIPCSVQSLAGTRFAGVVTFAINGSGVLNAADFVTLSTAIRIRLAQRGYGPGGLSACSVPWISATGAHAPDGKKSADTLRKKFADGRAVALYPDGRFRYATPGTPNVRFIHADANALRAFESGAAAAPVAPQTTQDAPQTRTAPQPPTQAQVDAVAGSATGAAASGGLTQTARCQDCNVRNVLEAEQCKACGLTEWQATV